MSRNLEQFNSGFFTVSGALVALSLFYPVYHSGKLLCSRVFQKNTKSKCESDCRCV